jgi:hypothetical protein
VQIVLEVALLQDQSSLCAVSAAPSSKRHVIARQTKMAAESAVFSFLCVGSDPQELQPLALRLRLLAEPLPAGKSSLLDRRWSFNTGKSPPPSPWHAEATRQLIGDLSPTLSHKAQRASLRKAVVLFHARTVDIPELTISYHAESQTKEDRIHRQLTLPAALSGQNVATRHEQPGTSSPTSLGGSAGHIPRSSSLTNVDGALSRSDSHHVGKSASSSSLDKRSSPGAVSTIADVFSKALATRLHKSLSREAPAWTEGPVYEVPISRQRQVDTARQERETMISKKVLCEGCTPLKDFQWREQHVCRHRCAI